MCDIYLFARRVFSTFFQPIFTGSLRTMRPVSNTASLNFPYLCVLYVHECVSVNTHFLLAHTNTYMHIDIPCVCAFPIDTRIWKIDLFLVFFSLWIPTQIRPFPIRPFPIRPFSSERQSEFLPFLFRWLPNLVDCIRAACVCKCMYIHRMHQGCEEKKIFL